MHYTRGSCEVATRNTAILLQYLQMIMDQFKIDEEYINKTRKKIYTEIVLALYKTE